MTNEEVAAYYERFTSTYVMYGGGAAGWHFSLREHDGVSHEEGLLHSDRLVTGGLGLGPGSRVLDAGCGMGGLTVFVARTFGARVTGVTLCAPHLELCARLAEQHGVSELVDFRCMDFMELDFPDGSFDCALSQETLNYVSDQRRFFRGLRRVLAPGGRYSAMEGFLSDRPLTDAGRSLDSDMQRGWITSPLTTVAETLDAVEAAGFVDVRAEPLSHLVERAAREILDATAFLPLIRGLGIRPPGLDDAALDHIFAGRAFSRGIVTGDFAYARLTAAVTK